MATFIALIDFTEQGIRNINETTNRSDSLVATAEKMGIKIRDVFWTSGVHDGVLIFEAPDDETASALMLYIGSLGNVRTQSLRAYSKSEMNKIISQMP